LPAPPSDKAGKAQHFLKTVAVVTSVLDDTQRNELADRIERGPEHKGRRGKRGGPAAD